jgi:NDP-sugar pyrophosphorylase family protein
MAGMLVGGVLAAGHGVRLRTAEPKALLEVGGKPLVWHAIEQLRAASADQIFCVTNSQCAAPVYGTIGHAPDTHVVVKDTPSALGTFEALLNLAHPHQFLFIAVDSLLPPGAGRGVVERLAADSVPPLALGVAPGRSGAIRQLGVEVDEHNRIVRLATSDGHCLVTAGIYGGHSRRLPSVPDEQTKWGLRDYLGWLVTSGMAVGAVRLPWGFDVDTPQDVASARAAWTAGPPKEA